MEATVSLFHDLRYEKKEETYPIKLCVIFNRKNKLYKTGIDLTKDDWVKMHSQKLRGTVKDARIECDLKLKVASDIIKSLSEFSYSAFEKQYLGSGFSKDVYIVYENYINNLDKEGRISTASSYACSRNSLKNFKTSLQFNEITPDFLQSYEKWMLKEGASITTVGIYLRALRTLVNQALTEGIIKIEQYPFGKRKYQIPTGKNIKKALTLAQVQKIFEYETVKGSTEDKAKDFWIFSYLCNGMNIKDIARLKEKDIREDKIVFTRAKTERTKRSNPNSIVVILNKEAKNIIKKWGNKQRTENSYVFPILHEKVTPKEERTLVQNFTHVINTWTKRIGEELKFEMPLTTYTARHSFSTVLKRSGAPVEFISEALGHTDISTTQNYLDSFDDNVKRDFASNLTAFTKINTKKKKEKATV